MHSDCKEALRELIAEGVQVDSIVTDPPYELGFMGKDWDKSGIANDVELWKLCLQVLKPGGHLLSFGGSRTYHRMATGIEDAGFEIRDQIMWIYGQGFPKSLDISKAIDKMEGAEREVLGTYKTPDGRDYTLEESCKNGYKATELSMGKDCGVERRFLTAPSTDLARQWDGWGSALKPAHEPIVMARKPLSEKNIASNVVKHGVGGINIDGCRVESGSERFRGIVTTNEDRNTYSKHAAQFISTDSPLGRFPANLIHDGSDEVEAEFAKYGTAKGYSERYTPSSTNCWWGKRGEEKIRYDMGGGSASRFFYSAKASAKERNGSKHPTVKPIALMRYLCRLVTPPNGVVLDPFAGTGTTGQAALQEGLGAILIEREAEYIADIKKRIEGVQLPLPVLEKVMEAITA